MSPFAGVLMDLTGLVCLGQERVPPRIIQGGADLVLVADLCHRRALQALQHAPGFGLCSPMGVGAWLTSLMSASMYSVP